MLQDVILQLLNEAHKENMTSIAIPALGTGQLGFPEDVVATVMYHACEGFSRDYPDASIKDIRFIIHDQDQATITVWHLYIKSLFYTSSGDL